VALALGEQVRRGFEQVNVAGDPEPVANSVFSGAAAASPSARMVVERSSSVIPV